MEEENMFKCPNDLSVSVTKFNGDILIKEDGCTVVQLLLKNTGEMATSFFGAHSPQAIKVMERALKGYFKKLKKTLKEEYKKDGNDEIEVRKDELPPEGTIAEIEKKTNHKKDNNCKCCKEDNKTQKKSEKTKAKKGAKSPSSKSKKIEDNPKKNVFECPLKTPKNKLAKDEGKKEK